MTLTIPTPQPDEYDEYYHQYVSKAQADGFLDAFTAQPAVLQDLLGSLPGGKVNKRHAPTAWTPKQVVGHLIDCERLFSTRMLRIGVGDESPIPGMEQDQYVESFDYEPISMQSLLDEFAALRTANVLLVQRMGPEALARRGMASGKPVSALANLFILAGHVVFHADSLRRRIGQL